MKKVLLGIIFITVIFSYCKKSDGNKSETLENSSEVLTVSAIRAKDIKSPDYIEYTGTLFSEQDVTVMPAVSGVIAKIYTEEGSFVKKGGLLALLDQQEFEIGLSQAKNQYDSARLAFEQSKIDFERTQKLYESKSISDAQYEGLKLKHQITENQMKMALDGLNMAKKRFDDSFIRAPFDCYVTHRMVSVGTRVNMMPPTPMFRIIDINNLLFKLSVPASELSNFKEGEKVEITFSDISEKIEEPVYKVIRDIDPRSMSSQVIIKIDNKKHNNRLKPGLFGTARIFSDAIKNTYILDKKYLSSYANGKGTVFVSNSQTAKLKEVYFKELNSVSVRITSGLSDEDVIITSGLNILKEGRTVKPVIK
ncbi:MAG: efflux RND transporter periplasmic adaptor subunit [Deltaproteobacteria bacterium]|nr:efflux RND transporter periplasmic adaptor subunit [Deltaproteobacteria bacterium]